MQTTSLMRKVHMLGGDGVLFSDGEDDERTLMLDSPTWREMGRPKEILVSVRPAS